MCNGSTCVNANKLGWQWTTNSSLKTNYLTNIAKSLLCLSSLPYCNKALLNVQIRAYDGHMDNGLHVIASCRIRGKAVLLFVVCRGRKAHESLYPGHMCRKIALSLLARRGRPSSTFTRSVTAVQPCLLHVTINCHHRPRVFLYLLRHDSPW